MIAYRISRKSLEALIRDKDSTWLTDADTRTDNFRKQGFYKEKNSIWSRVKNVYMTLQGEGKCAYCERKLESIEYGKGEQDVEHFRPKTRISGWRPPRSFVRYKIKFTTVPTAASGYYLLPYHPFNYAAACKPCNSALKRDYFPIAGDYTLDGDEPSALMSEDPFLIFPIGDFDEAPENLIRFRGVSPYPSARAGHRRARALVTIEFFKLDDETKRKNLIAERARVIIALHPQLEKLGQKLPLKVRLRAQSVVNSYTSIKSSHTNCARCYVEIFQQDRLEADALFDRACELIQTMS